MYHNATFSSWGAEITHIFKNWTCDQTSTTFSPYIDRSSIFKEQDNAPLHSESNDIFRKHELVPKQQSREELQTIDEELLYQRPSDSVHEEIHSDVETMDYEASHPESYEDLQQQYELGLHYLFQQPAVHRRTDFQQQDAPPPYSVHDPARPIPSTSVQDIVEECQGNATEDADQESEEKDQLAPET